MVTEQPQHSSLITSSRIMQISANGLIYNDLHRNQRNNFHIPNFIDFLWNSNVRKRLSPRPALQAALSASGFHRCHFDIVRSPCGRWALSQAKIRKVAETAKCFGDFSNRGRALRQEKANWTVRQIKLNCRANQIELLSNLN